jgi:hypothetical protein
MGTIRRQRISDTEIVTRYLAGESRDMLIRRAKLSDSSILTILQNNGIALRTSRQVKELVGKARQTHYQRRSARSPRLPPSGGAQSRGESMEPISCPQGRGMKPRRSYSEKHPDADDRFAA